MSIYHPSLYANLLIFFQEITLSTQSQETERIFPFLITMLSINKATLKYENFIIMGDFNIDINSSGVEKNKLEEFCNLLGLAKLIHGNTCCTKNHAKTTETTLVIIVRVFQVFFISYYIRLKPKVVSEL